MYANKLRGSRAAFNARRCLTCAPQQYQVCFACAFTFPGLLGPLVFFFKIENKGLKTKGQKIIPLLLLAPLHLAKSSTSASTMHTKHAKTPTGTPTR
jgi:hypothetical protein